MYGLNHAGQQQFNAGIACTVLSIVAVALRVFCKLRHKQGIRPDDYWLIGALGWYCASMSIALWGHITGGGGREMKELLVMVMKDPRNLHLVENFLESMFLSFTFLTVAVYAVKMSVLCFYRRIFFVTKGYQNACLVMMVVATLWFIATETANLLICRPIDSFWHRLKPGKCANFNVMFLGTGIADTLIDFIIVLLPVRIVLTLQLPRRTKFAVAGIFALGGFVVITGIIRLRYIYQPHAAYVSFANAEKWSNIHMVTAFVCACLPIYKPLWVSLSTATATFFSHFATSLRSVLGTSGSKQTQNTSYVRMGHSANSGTSFKSQERDVVGVSGDMGSSKVSRTTISVVGGKDEDLELLNVPRGAIAYTRDVRVV